MPVLLLASVAQAASPQPPHAAAIPHEVRTDFGAVRNDPYFWLRDDARSNPRVLDYLRAENAYTDRILEPMSALRATLGKELTARVPPQDSTVPFKERGYWYYVRFTPGQNYPLIAREERKPRRTRGSLAR